MTAVESKWERIRDLVLKIDVEVKKNVAGNAAAGTRARKDLRLLKTEASNLIKLTLGKEI